ncbi:MAG: pentapeptide repeat-containing protein [Bacteroidota bacterium]
MEAINHENKVFEKVSYSQKELKKRIFEKCTFNSCDFSNSNLSANVFNECSFNNCNMAMTKLNKTKLTDVFFKDCKLIGINFFECNDFMFSVNFENCLLDYASFASKKMAKTNFNTTSLKETNFSNADISGASFQNCNLEGTIFNKTLLKNTDFTGAYNYTIDPNENFIKKARFSKDRLEGLLTKYDITIE